MKKILITGSSGLIGSEVCAYFDKNGWAVHGIDNNMRSSFFGPAGDTRWNQNRLSEDLSGFTHHEIDIRDRKAVMQICEQLLPDAIVHAAAQPSHDFAASKPFDDFDVNAVGTFNLLESARQFMPNAAFVFMSTNKVYGDAPNKLQLKELDTRWEYDDPMYYDGIPETFSIDQSLHSLFGASKVAADIAVQEYGRYFGMKTCCLRGGCLTGPNHTGVELHGFLSYLVKCNLKEIPYTIFGYKGKQVRDNIHSKDVANFIYEFIKKPGTGEVYNLGGGKQNTCSITEAMDIVERITQKKMITKYTDENRIGDHICYYSDLTKIKKHYPSWDITINLEQIMEEIVDGYNNRA